MSVRPTLVLALILSLWGDGAEAGPWPREPGQAFLSLSVERDGDGNSHSGLYGEYGWTARHTLGFQIGHTNVGETNAMIWLQRALDDGQGPHRLAFSLGVGAVRREGQLTPLGRIGLAYGRGFEGFAGGGWFAVDTHVVIAGDMQQMRYSDGLTQVETSYLTPEMTIKGDVTLGLKPLSSLMVITQLRLEERQDEGFSAGLAASVVHDLIGSAKLELGLVEPLAGPGERAFKLGSWITF